VNELLNLVVALDERFDEGAAAQAKERLGGLGLRVDEREGLDGRTLAWIDLAFGGSWSGEAARARNVVASSNDAPVGFASFAPRGLNYRWLRGVAREPGVAVFGPFGVVEERRGRGVGAALATLALCALRGSGYRRALVAAVGEEGLVRWYARNCGATIAERFERSALMPRTRAVVMASGNGTNAEALAQAARQGRLPLDIAAVVTNRPSAGVLARAAQLGICSVVVEWNRTAQRREQYDEVLLQSVREIQPQLVLLLGWMHLLPQRFVGSFADLLNLHPAFLPLDPAQDAVVMPDGSTIPAFRGPRAVRDAIAAGSRWTGSTVHRVTAQTDRGPVIVRVPMPLDASDDETSATMRLRPLEHRLVTSAVTCWLYER
jgi:phosphoribosylglycinamide formyltransferase-1